MKIKILIQLDFLGSSLPQNELGGGGWGGGEWWVGGGGWSRGFFILSYQAIHCDDNFAPSCFMETFLFFSVLFLFSYICSKTFHFVKLSVKKKENACFELLTKYEELSRGTSPRPTVSFKNLILKNFFFLSLLKK